MAHNNPIIPDVPAYRAEWSPIYIEPIMGSGERITIAIAIQSDSEFRVLQAIRSDVIRCLYGSQANRFTGLIDIAMQDISQQLQSGLVLGNLAVPFEGVHIGEAYDAAADNIEGVMAQAIQLVASLSALGDVDEENIQEPSNEPANRQWVTQIRTEVVSLKPEFKSFFNARVKFYADGTFTRVGFLGNGYTSHFSILRPNAPATTYKDVRAKFWELAKIKDTNMDIHQACMCIYTPSESDLLYTPRQHKAAYDAVKELKREAEGNSLLFDTVQSTEEAAELIISRTAA